MGHIWFESATVHYIWFYPICLQAVQKILSGTEVRLIHLSIPIEQKKNYLWGMYLSVTYGQQMGDPTTARGMSVRQA